MDKNPKEIIIVSNGYHLPRIKVMLEVLLELKKLKKYIKLVSAEKIVIKHNKTLKNEVDNQQKHPAMKKIITKEKIGIKALRSGNYTYN